MLILCPFCFCIYIFIHFAVNRAKEAVKQYRVEAGAKVHVAAKKSKTEAEMQKLKGVNDKLTNRLHEEHASLRNMQQAMHDVVSCLSDKLDRVTNMRGVSPVGLAKALDLSPNSTEKVTLYSARGIWRTQLLEATQNGKT